MIRNFISRTPPPARLPMPCRYRASGCRAGTVPPDAVPVPCLRMPCRYRASGCRAGTVPPDAVPPDAVQPIGCTVPGTIPQAPSSHAPPPPTPCRTIARHQIPCLPSQARIAPGPLPRRHSHQPGNCLAGHHPADRLAGKTPPQNSADCCRHQIPCQLLLAPYRAGNSQHYNRRLQ